MKALVAERLVNVPFEQKLIDEILEAGKSKNVKSGEIILGKGIDRSFIPFVIDGLLRVERWDEERGELFLYYVKSGETCAMSVACCMEQNPPDIALVAETDSLLWMVPAVYLDRWTEMFGSFRKFIFRSYQQRFDELLSAVDNLAFFKLDERLMNYLLDRKQVMGTYVIELTHDQIARDLNTSRVVISRLLKKLEHEGHIEMHRNRIEIL